MAKNELRSLDDELKHFHPFKEKRFEHNEKQVGMLEHYSSINLAEKLIKFVLLAKDLESEK